MNYWSKDELFAELNKVDNELSEEFYFDEEFEACEDDFHSVFNNPRFNPEHKAYAIDLIEFFNEQRFIED
jgi:hypothetical protein